MDRYQKIKTKQLLIISLFALLFLTGCSTQKWSGVALYMSNYNYKKDTTDIVETIEQADVFDLSKEVNKAIQWLNGIDFEQTNILSKDNDSDSSNIIDTLELEDEKAIASTTEKILLKHDDLLTEKIKKDETILVEPIGEITLQKSPFHQQQVLNTPSPSRVKLQSGEYYLGMATGSTKPYLSGTSMKSSNMEFNQLQARVSELERENQQLRSALYNASSRSSNFYPMSTGYVSSTRTDKAIDDISKQLTELKNLITTNNTPQQQKSDAVFQGKLSQDTILKLDTIVKVEVIDNPQLVAEKESLQDSLILMHNYIKLKNKALSSLEGKMVSPQHRDSILAIAYYAPYKINSINEKEILSELNQKIVDKKIFKVSLFGFTDSSGSGQLNFRLSNQRIFHWVNLLTKNGIPRELIFMQFFGAEYASKEVVDNERRVEIIVELEK